MSKFRHLLIADGGNEKALREQGSILPTTPTKAFEEVVGDYQSFSEVAISCLQFVDQKPMHASLRVAAAERYGAALRVSINGRDGRAVCFLTKGEQVDDLIFRLQKLRGDLFGKCLEVVEQGTVNTDIQGGK